MNITAICQNCENVFRAPLTDTSDGVNCPHCGHRHVVPTGAVVPHDEGVTITRCVVCPSRELYLRKAFSQRLGLAIIATGFILSSIAWANHHIWWCYGILMASAVIDFLLWMVVKNLLQCYRCHAEYRGYIETDQHTLFSLEVHEKYRQEKHRLAEQARADAFAKKHADSETDA